jgi:hypothetical protein
MAELNERLVAVDHALRRWGAWAHENSERGIAGVLGRVVEFGLDGAAQSTNARPKVADEVLAMEAFVALMSDDWQELLRIEYCGAWQPQNVKARRLGFAQHLYAAELERVRYYILGRWDQLQADLAA